MSKHFVEPFSRDQCKSMCDFCANFSTEEVGEVDYTKHTKAIINVLDAQKQNKVRVRRTHSVFFGVSK